MSELFFTVFKHQNDYGKWEKHIEFALLENVSEETKENWVKALKFLQEELGNGFLKSADKSHPIQKKIFNKAPWQVQDLICFSNTLQLLKNSSDNYPKIKEKLLSRNDCVKEGIPFADIARSYLETNFNVRFLEEQDGIKTPDIEIINPLL